MAIPRAWVLKRWRRATAALCVTLCFAVCTTARADITVTDDLGSVLTLATPALRIVSLAPHVTELLFAAGAGSNVVGAVKHSDYPPAARNIARVGESKSVSYETLLALQPDLVITWHTGNGQEMTARLRELGLMVYVNEPRTLPDVARSVAIFGKLSGHDDSAAGVAEDFMATYTQLRQRYQQRAKVRVFYQMWDQPLMTLNGRHLISDVIRLCGGSNVFADAIPIAPTISIEAVLRADPQVIVASGMAEARPEWLDMWQAWPTLTAVRTRQLYFVPPDLLQRHTPRVLEGAQLLCAQLERTRALARP
jgi:iron complex transport system substrate-binding protein